MADKTGIEWTEATWNPVTGCSKVSPGCAHCYAETLSHRFGRTTLPWTPANAAANVQLHLDRLSQPVRWKQPRLIFVNSMSDLFHESIPAEFIDRIVEVMALACHHTYQVLTKRPERARELLGSGRVRELTRNVWLGASVESSRYNWRVDVLRRTPAAVRFLSAEPLLGSLFESGPRREPLDLTGIHWVIAGGESGAKARPMQAAWVREIRDKCKRDRIPFFFKQWGGRTPKAGGRLLDRKTYDEMPPTAEFAGQTGSLFPSGR